jgi:hypothetical protein
MVSEKKGYETSNPRISNNLVDYIKFIIKRYKDEYDIKIEFTEASNLLSKRAKEVKLFR